MTAAAQKAWFWVLGDAAFIFFLSSMSRPLPYIGGLEKYPLDKIFHVIEYSVFGWLLTRAIRLSFPRKSFVFLAALAFLVGISYGASDEWHQSFVPLRDSSLRDLAADAVGVICGITMWSRKKENFYA